MDHALVELAAANIAFVGLHFAMSHPLRGPMVGMLGEKGFAGVYSLVSLAALVWVVVAFRASPAGDLGGSGEAGWIAATVLMILALVLFGGSFSGNPAMPRPDAAEHARAEPQGVFLVTRHPMMWSFALWALAHVLLYWSTRTMITAGAMGFLALVGAHLQDRKKQALMGEAWSAWQSKTSYWPRLDKLLSVGWKPWALAIVLWLVFSWLHRPIAGIDAGVLRWQG